MKKEPFSEKNYRHTDGGMKMVNIARGEYDGDDLHTTFSQDSYFVADWSVSVESIETTSNNTLDIPHTQYFIPDWFTADGFAFNKE